MLGETQELILKNVRGKSGTYSKNVRGNSGTYSKKYKSTCG